MQLRTLLHECETLDETEKVFSFFESDLTRGISEFFTCDGKYHDSEDFVDYSFTDKCFIGSEEEILRNVKCIADKIDDKYDDKRIVKFLVFHIHTSFQMFVNAKYHVKTVHSTGVIPIYKIPLPKCKKH